ncbi:hypothetical protein PGT21_010220 [Puccinia graminis f. sp. tritici]|uniref:Uncharacterized protein n=1 Tax=Puccinia graminis f. sp. tritici TaxID=56615 RepID=A0A5B0Q2J1_PUCGR|nr:hypothetical protein PGT21_010220 [Puccinia graminis f. sp. tritici]KAA1124907.1 hypothetical protein PGTUg99_036591 [Puccinia graminis f. sp. tritici]
MTSFLSPGSQINDQTSFILCKNSARSSLQQSLDPPSITTLEYNNSTVGTSLFLLFFLRLCFQLEETAVGLPQVLNLFMLFSAHYGSVESAVMGRTSSPQSLITSHVNQLAN